MKTDVTFGREPTATIHTGLMLATFYFIEAAMKHIYTEIYTYILLGSAV